MDKVDIKLLSALEKDARVSLKNLAKELNVKTSTIYHRLHKLREANILERYSIVINPDHIGLTTHALIAVRLAPISIGKLDQMFLESFANYLAEQYSECLFSATADDEQIWLICTFKDDTHLNDFLASLKQNKYVDEFRSLRLTKIVKGRKIFTFDKNLISDDDSGEYFDDEAVFEDFSEEVETEAENKEEEDDGSSEIFF